MPHELHNVDGTTLTVGFDVLLAPRDVAALMKVDVRTVNRWAREGLLFAVKTHGGHRRYPEACVRAFINGDYENSSKPPVGKSPLLVISEK